MSQTILVIDDSLVASKVTENVFAQNLGHVDVMLAPGANEGFQRIMVSQPDLILLNDSLPDMDGESVCFRLLNNPLTARVPVVVMSGNGHGDALKEKFANVVKAVPKPVTSEALLSAINSQLALVKTPPHPASSLLFRDATKVVFAAHTGFFSLRNALQMACGDKLTGVLRVFINQYPIELFFSEGRLLLATTRNFQLYLRDSPIILNSTSLGLLAEGDSSKRYGLSAVSVSRDPQWSPAR